MSFGGSTALNSTILLLALAGHFGAQRKSILSSCGQMLSFLA
jgi:hypothetical protein